MPIEARSGVDLLFEKSGRTSLLWQRQESALSRISLFDMNISNMTLDAAVRDMVDAALERRRLRIAFVNAHVVNTAAARPAYGRVVASADRIYADGSGMALAAKLCGRPLLDNVNGTDMFPLLCAAAAKAGITIFLLGGRPGVTERAAAAVADRGFGRAIAGTHHGYVRRGGQEEREAVDAINASGASIVLVGMGVPTQDIWVARNADKIGAPVVAGVGGLFDFFAGSVSRAPLWLRSHGLEWTWRLAQEPRRMAGRYLLGNVAFIGRAAFHALEIKVHRSASGNTWAGRTAGLAHSYLRAKIISGVPAKAKRCIDIAGAVSALALFGPLMVAVGAAIRLDSRGGALFRQTRIGLNGHPFTMFKFRSMRLDAEAGYAELKGEISDRRQIRFKAKDDPRVTRIGRFIRKASIDELPQIWNVLRGEMSLVGPRPGLPSEVANYSHADRDRLLAKPGITCTWQVSGRANIDFVGQVELDRTYVRSQSIWGDLSLIARTIPAIIASRGAY